MTVLIVDDQPSVVSGIYSGVQWGKIGVTRVLKAYNPAEAKLEFLSHPIDVMLCDIEMPEENGLSLYNWVKAQGYPAKCIFLTSHAEFLYAKQAITLGGFDYIVQPARYEDIQSAIERAVATIQAEREAEEYTAFGKEWYAKREQMQDGMLRSFFMGEHIDKEVTQSSLLAGAVGQGQAQLCLLCVLRQNKAPLWEQGLLRFALSNILNELLEAEGNPVRLVPLEEQIYGFALPQPKSSAGLKNALNQILHVGKNQLGCDLAAYVSTPGCFDELPAATRRMLALAADNVTLRSAVFFEQELPVQLAEGPHATGGIPPLTQAGWSALLSGGEGALMEKEAGVYLDKMIADKVLNAEALMRFYRDFTQVIYSAARELGVQSSELMASRAALRTSLDAYTSVDRMRAFIRDIALAFADFAGEQGNAKQQIESILAYIHANIERNIRRSDIAENVYLNPDYVSRLFKKETGLSLKEYIIEQKMRVAKKLLRTTELPISIIALRVGYSHFSHFSQTYKKIMGITPMEERQKASAGAP